METKMRVKLWKDGQILSDRLVEQTTEFTMGPKTKHDGPLSLELNLREKEDVTKAIEYLGKLALDLPLNTDKPKKAEKATNKMLSDKQPLLDLKQQMITPGKIKNQEELIEKLRQYNFRFVHSQLLEEINDVQPGVFKLNEKHQGWQFMVRLEKEAKIPQNDKWDTRLAFGIKIVGTRVDKILVYWWGKFEKRVEMEWADKKKINYKKKEKIMQFPAFMNYDERRKWRAENRKILKAKEEGTELTPTKFYDRWASHVTIG